MRLSWKDQRECIGCQSKADWLKLGLWGTRPQINEGKETEFSVFWKVWILCFVFKHIALKRSLWGHQYVTLHFNAFAPPDALDKNLFISYQKKSLFLTFLPQGLDLNIFFSEVKKFSPVSSTLIIIIFTIKQDSYQNVISPLKEFTSKKVH